MTEPIDAAEARVLGALLEKERTTPQSYPLTLNALRLACNQSTGREPVVDYDEGLVERVATGLKPKGYVRFVHSPGNRGTKYRQVLDEALHLAPDEVAVLALLLLRGAQTPGELKARAERLHDFADLAAVHAAVDRLADRPDGALVARLERQPGQKEARVAQLLTGPPEAAPAAPTHAGPDLGPDGPADDLRAEVDALRAEVASLRRELDDFRRQFE